MSYITLEKENVAVYYNYSELEKAVDIHVNFSKNNSGNLGEPQVDHEKC